MNREQILTALRQLGIRVTRQRLAVAEVLVNARDHPTAQEVCDRARVTLPQISLATIYNTIAILINSGFIQSLSFGEATRYDANLAPHANLVCVRCGAITDVPDECGEVTKLRDNLCATMGFQATSQRVDFYGVCARCATDSGR